MLEATLGTELKEITVREDLSAQIRASRKFPAVARVPFPAGSTPFDWLRTQTVQPRLIWSNRDDPVVLAGSGCAARVEANSGEAPQRVFDRCRAILDSHAHLRFYGGFAFRDDQASFNESWASFGAATFWLPRVTFDGKELGVVIMDEEDRGAALRSVDELVLAAPHSNWQLPTCLGRSDLPDQETWNRNVEASLSLFGDEVLDKIVLVRKATFTFDQKLCAVALTDRLADATHSCYHFCFEPKKNVAFLGATPERLFLRRDRELSSEVVAGTRRRDSDPAEDRRLADELLASTKDQLEHDIVRKSIRQRLHAYVESLQVDDRASLLKLAKKQHLFSRVKARLRHHVDDGQLLSRLHPTPAVGGYPTENAMEEIERLEPFDRGWYAGPVGWIGAIDAEFAVAIRSGLLVDHRLSLYSGAGIVPGSTPQLEWEEIEHKIGDFLEVIACPTDEADGRRP